MKTLNSFSVKEVIFGKNSKTPFQNLQRTNETSFSKKASSYMSLIETIAKGNMLSFVKISYFDDNFQAGMIGSDRSPFYA